MRMKTFGLAAAAMALIMCATSCDSKSSLSKKLQGTWATNSEEVQFPNALNATAVKMFQFNTPDGATNPTGGNIEVSMMLNVTTMAPVSDSIVQPYSVSASAIASIQGSWKAIDDDEVLVDLQPQTFVVEVNPETVTQEDNILSDENFSVVDSIKPALASEIKREIQTQCLQKLLNVKKIDDIEFRKNGDMKCEINNRDYYFHSQAVAE